MVSASVAAGVVVMVVAVLGTVRGQRYRPGPCPTYQTSDKFNAEKISQIVSDEGYMTVMSVGSEVEEQHTCQILDLYDSTSYSYTYTDQSNSIQKLSGTYKATPSSFKFPGAFDLSNLEPGLLGADVFGNVRLFPIFMGVADVYVSCTSFGFFHSERVYVLSPLSQAKSTSTEATREALQLKGIPKADRLIINTKDCGVGGSGEATDIKRSIPAGTSTATVTGASAAGGTVTALDITANVHNTIFV